MKVALMAGIRKEYISKFLPKIEIVLLNQNPDAIFARSDTLNEENIPPSVYAVCRAGTGVDNIPLDFCNNNGVVVFNAPGANANAVKELIIWAILTAGRNLAKAIEFRCSRRYWDRKTLEMHRGEFVGREILGKSILIIGAGAIGKLLIQDLRALGMSVFAYDPFVNENLLIPAVKIASLENMPPCDFISINCLLSDETRGMVNDQFLSRIKPGATILNFARPELVDKGALKSALRNGMVWQYISDFHDRELSMLFMDRVITLPHLGAMTEEAERRAQEMAARQFLNFWQTGAIENSVNFPRFEPKKKRADAVRFVVCNKNIPGVIYRIAGVIARFGYNVCYDEHPDPGKSQFAYMVVDIDNPDEKISEAVQEISRLEGVTKARLIR